MRAQRDAEWNPYVQPSNDKPYERSIHAPVQDPTTAPAPVAVTSKFALLLRADSVGRPIRRGPPNGGATFPAEGAGPTARELASKRSSDSGGVPPHTPLRTPRSSEPGHQPAAAGGLRVRISETGQSQDAPSGRVRVSETGGGHAPGLEREPGGYEPPPSAKVRPPASCLVLTPVTPES